MCVEENARAAAAGLDRHARRALWCFWERADARGNIVEEVLLNWRAGEADVQDGRRRIRARVKARGVVIVANGGNKNRGGYRRDSGGSGQLVVGVVVKRT